MRDDKRRKKPEPVTPGEGEGFPPGDSDEPKLVTAGTKEAQDTHNRVLYVVRQQRDERVNSDLLAAVIIIGVVVGLSLIAYWVWIALLSHPARP